MCRYAEHRYKSHFACFGCRKVFRQLLGGYQNSTKSDVRCPQCRVPMTNIGKDFKAPKQTDEKQWRKIELLVQQGFAFHSCGCGGSGPCPRRLNEVPAFLTDQALLQEKRVQEAKRQVSEERWRQLRRWKRKQTTLKAVITARLLEPS